LDTVSFQNVDLMANKCNFHRVCNVLSDTAIFAAISKMYVAFEEVLTKEEEQGHFLKQNATLRPTNFTNVWLKCAKMIALPWAGSNGIFSAISRMTGFFEKW